MIIDVKQIPNLKDEAMKAALTARPRVRLLEPFLGCEAGTIIAVRPRRVVQLTSPRVIKETFGDTVREQRLGPIAESVKAEK